MVAGERFEVGGVSTVDRRVNKVADAAGSCSQGLGCCKTK